MPHLDDPAGRHFRFRDLIEAGETFAAHRTDNTPKQPDTWTHLAELAQSILDPVADRFGRPRITHGFTGPELIRRIPGRIAPQLDQHAGNELNRKGNPICKRPGQAADFQVPHVSSLEIARFVVKALPFDRLYYYGDDRPLHVSVGPERAGYLCVIERKQGGHGHPRTISREKFLTD